MNTYGSALMYKYNNKLLTIVLAVSSDRVFTYENFVSSLIIMIVSDDSLFRMEFLVFL